MFFSMAPHRVPRTIGCRSRRWTGLGASRVYPAAVPAPNENPGSNDFLRVSSCQLCHSASFTPPISTLIPRCGLSPASMQELPNEVVQLNDLVAERLPRVELAEVLIEVDSWTGFTQFFRHAGGARSRNPDLVRHVYAAILAQACNFGLTTMADIADLTYRQLAWTTDWCLREETLKAAFSALVDFQHQLPLAEAWGGGTLSSSDGQ